MVGRIDVKAPNVSGAHNIRVRPFRNGDLQQVRDLYMIAMEYDRESFICIPSRKSKSMRVPWDLFPAGSPRHMALRAQLTHPSSIVMYGLFMGGLALSLSPSTRVIGSLLCLSVFGTFAGLRWLLSRFFTSYCENSLKADLVDIGKHYCVSESEDTRNAPSSASCFWVIEAYSDVTEYCEIVGTVGLGTSVQLAVFLLTSHECRHRLKHERRPNDRRTPQDDRLPSSQKARHRATAIDHCHRPRARTGVGFGLSHDD